MATAFRCHVNTHSRGAGHSAVAGAAYRAGEALTDERTGEKHDYTHKGGIEHSEIVLSANAPEWARDRSALWNAAEASEKHPRATVGREFQLAFPAQLSFQERLGLVRQFSEEVVARHGVAVDFAMHEPDKRGDQRNFHAHVLVSTRRMDESGFGEKARELDSYKTRTENLAHWTERWATLTGEALERNGYKAEGDRWRYGHLVLGKQVEAAEARGDWEFVRENQGMAATIHLGPEATELERQGVLTRVGDVNRGVDAAREEATKERADTASKLEEDPSILVDRVAQRNAVFTRQDLARELHLHVEDADKFQSILIRAEASGKLVELPNGELSTRHVIETERALVDGTKAMSERASHPVNRADVLAAVAARPTMTDEQKAALDHVTSDRQFAAIVGDAGTGKSYLMGAARETWEANGYRVIGMALSGKAADELRASSGIDSRTIHSHEARWDMGIDTLTARDVLVIDEAGMVGTEQLERVRALADEAGAKVVWLGDHKQLSAIDYGAGHRTVVERVGAAELTQVIRQREAWAKAASYELRRGDFDTGFNAYVDRGYLKQFETRDEARQALVDGWMRERALPGSQAIMSHSNKEVKALNESVRQALKDAGELGEGAKVSTERGTREFSRGDQIVFLKNDKTLEVKNGTLGHVEYVSDGVLSVRFEDGRTVGFDAKEYAHIDHGYALTIHKEQGASVDRAHVMLTPGMDRNLTYVAMTRHKDGLTMHAAREDFAKPRGEPWMQKTGGVEALSPALRESAELSYEAWGEAKPELAAKHDFADYVSYVQGKWAEENRPADGREPGDFSREIAERIGRENVKRSTLDILDPQAKDEAERSEMAKAVEPQKSARRVVEPWMQKAGGAASLSATMRESAQRSYEDWAARKPEAAAKYGFEGYVDYVQGKWAEEQRGQMYDRAQSGGLDHDGNEHRAAGRGAGAASPYEQDAEHAGRRSEHRMQRLSSRHLAGAGKRGSAGVLPADARDRGQHNQDVRRAATGASADGLKASAAVRQAFEHAKTERAQREASGGKNAVQDAFAQARADRTRAEAAGSSTSAVQQAFERSRADRAQGEDDMAAQSIRDTMARARGQDADDRTAAGIKRATDQARDRYQQAAGSEAGNQPQQGQPFAARADQQPVQQLGTRDQAQDIYVQAGRAPDPVQTDAELDRLHAEFDRDRELAASEIRTAEASDAAPTEAETDAMLADFDRDRESAASEIRPAEQDDSQAEPSAETAAPDKNLQEPEQAGTADAAHDDADTDRLIAEFDQDREHAASDASDAGEADEATQTEAETDAILADYEHSEDHITRENEAYERAQAFGPAEPGEGAAEGGEAQETHATRANADQRDAQEPERDWKAEATAHMAAEDHADEPAAQAPEHAPEQAEASTVRVEQTQAEKDAASDRMRDTMAQARGQQSAASSSSVREAFARARAEQAQAKDGGQTSAVREAFERARAERAGTAEKPSEKQTDAQKQTRGQGQ